MPTRRRASVLQTMGRISADPQRTISANQRTRGRLTQPHLTRRRRLENHVQSDQTNRWRPRPSARRRRMEAISKSERHASFANATRSGVTRRRFLLRETMSVNVTVDATTLLKLSATVLRQLPYALNQAVNRTAKLAVEAGRLEVESHFQ